MKTKHELGGHMTIWHWFGHDAEHIVLLVFILYLLFALIFAVVQMLLAACIQGRDVLDNLRRHLRGCVVENHCPRADSRLHVALERFMWWFLKRPGFALPLLGFFLGAYGVGLCVLFNHVYCDLTGKSLI